MCQPKEVSLIPPKITSFIYLNFFFLRLCRLWLLAGWFCKALFLVKLHWNNREKHCADRLNWIEVNIFDGCDSVVFFMRNESIASMLLSVNLPITCYTCIIPVKSLRPVFFCLFLFLNKFIILFSKDTLYWSKVTANTFALWKLPLF